MLNQFQAYLVQRGYREFSINGNPSTAIDYAWRVAKVCEKENYTAKQLADNINTILDNMVIVVINGRLADVAMKAISML